MISLQNKSKDNKHFSFIWNRILYTDRKTQVDVTKRLAVSFHLTENCFLSVTRSFYHHSAVRCYWLTIFPESCQVNRRSCFQSKSLCTFQSTPLLFWRWIHLMTCTVIKICLEATWALPQKSPASLITLTRAASCVIM